MYKYVPSCKCSLVLNEDYTLVQWTHIQRLVYNLRISFKIGF